MFMSKNILHNNNLMLSSHSISKVSAIHRKFYHFLCHVDRHSFTQTEKELKLKGNLTKWELRNYEYLKYYDFLHDKYTIQYKMTIYINVVFIQKLATK